MYLTADFGGNSAELLYAYISPSPVMTNIDDPPPDDLLSIVELSDKTEANIDTSARYTRIDKKIKINR